MKAWTAWHRLTGEASIASLGKLIGAAVAIVLMAGLGHGPTHDHQAVLYIWLGVGLVPVIMQRLVPWMKVHAPAVEVPFLLSMGFIDMSVVIAIISLTGGVSGPFWILAIVTTAGSSVIAPGRVIAMVQSLGMSGGIVLGDWIAHDLNRQSAGPLVLITVCGAVIAVLGAAVSCRLEEESERSAAERDQLQATVEDLSRALALAAQGDLSVRVDSEQEQELLG
ncbi:MAG: hypothetical protein JO214_07800, partial [Frankiaceae bacterium]|nr:hypothetical protein [Frankiaceae bacterium]